MDEEGLSSLGVMQIDSAKGLPLTCLSHQTKYWCPCRSKVVTDGADGNALWFYMLTNGSVAFEVHVHITKDTIIRVTLYTDEWKTDRDTMRLEVSLRGKDIAERDPFKSDHRLTRLGWLNYGEGRGVLRELIINRFAGIFVMQERECRSKHHGPVEHMAYLKSRTHPARAWDWDYSTWYEGGVCPICYDRQQMLLAAAVDVNTGELVKKAESIEPRPWEVEVPPLRPIAIGNRKPKRSGPSMTMKDFVAKLQRPEPGEEVNF